MYQRKEQQTDMFEDATLFGGVRLDPRNKWVRLAKLVPWEVFEERYAASFVNPQTGNPAKPARMAIASLITKKRYGFSDRDTVEEIRKNPYLQYFLGFPAYSYSDKKPVQTSESPFSAPFLPGSKSGGAVVFGQILAV